MGDRSMNLPRMIGFPLLPNERDGIEATLSRAGLPVDDLDKPGRLFWRFSTPDELPVGFGGLEVHGREALMRSIVTLPPVRGRGFGRAIVAALETEAKIAGSRNVWLLTDRETEFFARAGYSPCDRHTVPEAIRSSEHFASLDTKNAVAMMKRLA
jgi:amino-acid N-acetyltransferase